jgi:hypothetical protein
LAAPLVRRWSAVAGDGRRPRWGRSLAEIDESRSSTNFYMQEPTGSHRGSSFTCETLRMVESSDVFQVRPHDYPRGSGVPDVRILDFQDDVPLSWRPGRALEVNIVVFPPEIALQRRGRRGVSGRPIARPGSPCFAATAMARLTDLPPWPVPTTDSLARPHRLTTSSCERDGLPARDDVRRRQMMATSSTRP